jgi:DNA-3-methyladenine glycosylase I
MSESEGAVVGPDGLTRCWWCGTDPLYQAYHDREWGRPVADDTRLFEKICLEGFQSGLSWLTILRKRDSFRRGFAGFDAEAITEFGAPDIERLLGDAGIVRHRGKIESVINNARRLPALTREFGSLAAFLWHHEPRPADRPARRDRATLMTITQTNHSEAISRALRKRGWSFVGPTTMYAMMQAVGIVNDHVDGCFVQAECDAERARFTRPA